MCRPVECNTCHGTTWNGCGLHIPRAMSEVPIEEFCSCLPIVYSGRGEYPPKLGQGTPKDEWKPPIED
ncbi:hypothetical protein CLIB1423_07S05204 [[Candida] railenensis]|uniref:Uncharacterized protein n=1 Tax=[Candida] railenensis TaxID=45579 RepID=A0A9P0QNV3_9ASCO|nr:hypothetical protein CLIB1423_07S05204 [[Candida] railenensis]